MTNADRIRAMTDEELAGFLSGIAYIGTNPWSEAFCAANCNNCPTTHVRYQDSGREDDLHECDFTDGLCPHGDDVRWWIRQPAGKEAANG